ncbi:hypothetical protein SE88_02135 [Helicobacter pylori]|nr:hypothetical protein SE88_02135 [Helicobacter pylori]
MKQISISCSHRKYFVSFSVEYEQDITPIKNTKNGVGLDLNILDTACSCEINNHDKLTDFKQYQTDMKELLGIEIDEELDTKRLIPTYSKLYSLKKYSKKFKRLQRKQSRRIKPSL